MPPQAVFGISVAFSFVVWGIVTYQYVWPALRSQPRANALRPILLLHSFRFVGLAFLVPGVVSPELPIAFAGPAAYGDLATAILAVLAFATLRSPLGIILVWAFNLLGTADLLHAFYQGNRTGLGLAPGLQGAAYFIPTVLVPLLLITHGLVFRLLLKGRTPGDHRASAECLLAPLVSFAVSWMSRSVFRGALLRWLDDDGSAVFRIPGAAAATGRRRREAS